MAKKSLKHIFLCSAILALTLTGTSWAAGEFQTEEIKVTATRTEKDLMEVPMSVGVVSDKSQKSNPQTSIADMLSSLPGVSVMDGGMPGGKRVQIRGESPLRSLILIDGVKVSEQKSMSGSAILMDTSQIERIEVIKGPASVLYGSEAIGGVVNIITKKGGKKPIGFSQNLIYDSSNNGLEVQSAVFGSYNGFNYRFTGSGVNAHDRWAGDGKIDNSDYKNRYYSGQVGYDWEKGSVYLKADKYNSDINIPSNVSTGRHTFGSYSGATSTTTVSLDLPKWNRESISSGLELRDLTEHFVKMKVTGYFQNMEKKFNNNIHVNVPMPSFPVPGSIAVDQNIQTVNDQDSFGGTTQTEWRFGKHYVIAGVDYNKDKLSAQDNRLGGYTRTPGRLPGMPPSFGWITKPSPQAFYRYKVDQENIGAFVQDEWTFHDDWALTLGARETWVRSAFNKNDNPNLATASDENDSRLVGNAGLVYSGFKDLALRAMWSQGYRFPSLNQLYLGTVHGQTSNTLPNPNLSPETSNSYELGARFTKANWSMDLAAFYTHSKNYITTKKLTTGDSMFDNINLADTWGMELAVDYTFKELNITPYATATWLYREYDNTIDLVNGGGRRSYTTSKSDTPPLQGLVGVKWEKDVLESTKLFTDLFVRWATNAESYDYDSTYTGTFQTSSSHAWQTLNFTVGLQGGEETKWNVALSLRNLLNKNYRQSGNGVDDPGFHAVLAAGVEF